MARQRRPVQSLQEALQAPIRPAAGPVSAQPTAAPPPDLPIYDFAAISQTVAGFLAQQQKKRNQKAVQEGEQFVEENRLLVSHLEEQLAGIDDPAERDRVMRDQFAFLQRNGTVPPMGDPFHRVGYHRAVGRLMAGKYWQALQARLDEVTAVKDEHGDPVLRPVEPEQVMAQEWEKIRKSPSVQDFYGGQEALAAKQQADAQFLERVTARRARAEEEQYLSVLAQEGGQRFDTILHDRPVVTSADLQPITDYLTTEVQQHNVLNPRQVVMQALELSIRRKAAVDPDEALRTVHAAQDLVVGGVRLGDDRGTPACAWRNSGDKFRSRPRSTTGTSWRRRIPAGEPSSRTPRTTTSPPCSRQSGTGRACRASPTGWRSSTIRRTPSSADSRAGPPS